MTTLTIEEAAELIRPWLMGEEPTVESVGRAIGLADETNRKWMDLIALDHAASAPQRGIVAKHFGGTWDEIRAEEGVS